MLVIRMILITALVLAYSPAMAKDKVLIINDKTIRKHTKPKGDANTKVINIKGITKEKSTGPLKGNICKELKGRFFCKNIGRAAVLRETDMITGKIIGVAWKNTADAIGLYLPDEPIEDTVDKAGGKVRNFPVMTGAFYYIIKDKSRYSPFMVECSRIKAEKL
jgi:hypothetical protein